MQNILISRKRTARQAGWLYPVILIAVVYGHMYVPSQIFVNGDPAATAHNIVANEYLFRTCIIAGLIETTAFLLLALTLYRLFKDSMKQEAKMMLALMAVQVPVAIIFSVLKFLAIIILKNNGTEVIATADIPGVVMMILNVIRYGSIIVGFFGALWLLPLGMMVLKARFIPRSFGIFLLVAGSGSLVHGFLTILIPNYSHSPLPAFSFFILGYIPIMFWFLIIGVKDHIVIPVISERQLAPDSLPSFQEVNG